MGDTSISGRPDGGIPPSLRRLVDAGARWVLLPTWRGYSGATWLEGLVLAESAGDPGAMRFESHLDLGGADPDAPGRDDGLGEDDRSYGLMQVMGTNLRSMVGVAPGVRMDFSWALFPMANLAFGLRLLAALLNQARRDVKARAPVGFLFTDGVHTFPPLDVSVDLALARYNGGLSGNAAADWPSLRNRAYVDRVAAHAGVAREQRRRANWVEAE